MDVESVQLYIDHAVGHGNHYTVGANLLYLLWPLVDHCDVEPGLCEVSANRAADGAAAEYSNFFVGHFLRFPVFTDVMTVGTAIIERFQYPIGNGRVDIRRHFAHGMKHIFIHP